MNAEEIEILKELVKFNNVVIKEFKEINYTLAAIMNEVCTSQQHLKITEMLEKWRIKNN